MDKLFIQAILKLQKAVSTGEQAKDMTPQEFSALCSEFTNVLVFECFTTYTPFRKGVPSFMEEQDFDFNLRYLSTQIRALSEGRKLRDVMGVFIQILKHSFDLNKGKSFFDILGHIGIDTEPTLSVNPGFREFLYMIVLNLANDMSQHESPSHISKLEGLTWSECFAICTAGMISIAVYCVKPHPYKRRFSPKEELLFLESFTAPIHQAIIIAATLSPNKNIWSDAAASYKKFNGQKGGKKKAQKLAPLKNKVLRLCDEKYGHIEHARPIALRILGDGYRDGILTDGDLDESDVMEGRYPLITKGNEEQTVSRWIRDHRKNK